MQLVTIWFLIQGMYQCAFNVCIAKAMHCQSAVLIHCPHLHRQLLPIRHTWGQTKILPVFRQKAYVWHGGWSQHLPLQTAVLHENRCFIKQSVPGRVNSCKICFGRISPLLLVSGSDNSFWPEQDLMTIQPGLCRRGFHKSQSQNDVTGCLVFPDKESENLCFTVHFPQPIWKAKTRCAEMFCTETFLAFRLQTSGDANLHSAVWIPSCHWVSNKGATLITSGMMPFLLHFIWLAICLDFGSSCPSYISVVTLSSWQYFALVKLWWNKFG